MTTLRVAKQELRKLMKQRLLEIPTESIRSQSQNVYEALINFQPYIDAKRIGIYLAMPNAELQTESIVRHALSNNKRVFVPYLHKVTAEAEGIPKSVMDMIDLRSIEEFESLQRDKWGIPTIDADSVSSRERILGDVDCPIMERKILDLILVPGVAFDFDSQSGFIKRLGHGKGFYDFFLERYFEGTEQTELLSTRPGSGLKLYGLALKEQYLAAEAVSVPVGPQDSLIHGLVCGNGKVMP